MIKQTTRPPKNVIETKAVHLAPAAVSAPRALHAWEMTLEQFRERFFPELCGDGQSSATESVPQRNAA